MIRKTGGWLILLITIAICCGVIYTMQAHTPAEVLDGTIGRERAKWLVRVLAAGYILYALLVHFRILGKAPGVDPVFDSEMSKRPNKCQYHIVLAVVLIGMTIAPFGF